MIFISSNLNCYVETQFIKFCRVDVRKHKFSPLPSMIRRYRVILYSGKGLLFCSLYFDSVKPISANFIHG